MTTNTAESRVNVFLRLAGLFFFALGAATTYFTWSEVSSGNVVPEIAPVFYLVGILLVIVGLAAALVKYR